MPAEELAQILQFCQPGTVIDPNVAREGTVGACKIYEFVTDSGQNLGTVCEETVDLGNGTLATIKNFCTVAAGSGLATLSGIAAMPVALTTGIQILTAVLGVSSGIALYNSFPDFFNMVSDAIFGDAVDHLPVIFFDSHGNIRVAEDTLNKVKEVAVSQNIYESTTINTDQEASVQFQQYLNGIRQLQIPFATNDNPTVSEVFDFLEHYTDIYSYTDRGSAAPGSIKETFQKLFNLDSDLPGADVRRRTLLKWLNKYYDPDKNYLRIWVRKVNNSSNPLTPYNIWLYSKSKDLYEAVRTGEALPIVRNGEFVDTNIRSFLYNYNYTGIDHLFLFNTTASSRSYLDGATPSTIDQNNRLLITKIPFNYFGHVFRLYGLYASQGLPDNAYYKPGYQFFNPDTGEYLSCDDNDADFFDIIQGKVGANNQFDRELYNYDIMGQYDDDQASFTSIGIDAIVNSERYTWVYPDTVIPQRGVPVTETYPNLDIITDPGIGNLIAVTPPELMPNPSQEAAQSSDPDANPGGYADFITDNISDVNPSPEPSPDPAPDPSPSPEPAPEPSPNPQPSGDDPVNPNPKPNPDPTPVIDPTLQSIDSSRLFTVYWLSANELDQLGAYLWSTNFITAVEKIWQDPMQAIISLKKVYAQPLSISRQNIILGFLDSGVSARVVSSQFVSKSYGTISVKEIMHNATDYSPYSQAMIYLPFIGIEQIDIDDIMGGDLTVRYTFDLYTGICIAELFVLRDDLTPQKMLYTFTGNVAQDVPLTSASFQGFFSTLMSIASTPLLVGSGGGILAASHLAHSMNHELVHISHSGNLSANAGIMGNRYPQLILTNRNRYDAAAYNTIYGYPANKTVYLGNCSGYTKVKAIQLQTFATQDEKDEIEKLLKEGVIF